MKRRSLLWTAVGVLLFGAGTGLMVRLQEGGGGRGAGGDGFDEPPPMPVVHPRPAAPGEVPTAPSLAPELRVVVRDPEGAPLAGAAVRLRGDRRAHRSPFPHPVLAEGRTGVDGAVVLTGVPLLASWLAEASLPGRADGAASGPGPVLEVVLPRGARISGRVVEEGTGAPVPGARVEMLESTAFAVADAGGTWSLEELPPGRATLTVFDPLHGPPPEPVVVDLAEGAAAAVDLVVPRGVTITGRVLYAGAEGRPVAGGSLRMDGWKGFLGAPRWRREAPLDGEGRFRLEGVPVDRDTECLVTTAEGLVLGVPFKGATAGGGEVTLLVPGNLSVEDQYGGRVTDARGRPVAGARVVIGWSVLWNVTDRDQAGPKRRGAGANEKAAPSSNEAFTDAEGRYRIPGTVERGREALVLHPDHAPRFVILPPSVQRNHVDFVLGDPVSLLVLVTDAAGLPAAGVEVLALLRRPGSEPWEGPRGDVLEGMRPTPVTDPSGRAVVGPLGAGSWFLVALASDGRSAARVVVEVEEGAPTSVVEMTLAPLRDLTGRVLDLDGRPMEGVAVSSTDELTGRGIGTATDADGRFSLGPRAPFCWPEESGRGCWIGLGTAGDRFPNLEATPGIPATFLLPRPGDIARTVTLEVLGADGRPALGGSWEIRFPGGRGGTAEGWGESVHPTSRLSPRIPVVLGRGAVLEVRSPGNGSASIPLDSLPEKPEPLLLRR